jgi:hypothetical protein
MSALGRAGAAGVSIVLVAVSSALAAPPPGSSREDRRLYAISELIDQAAAKVERDNSCRPRPNNAGPTADTPSAALLQTLAPLRRPQQPAEQNALNVFAPVQFPSAYRDYVRIVHTPGGTAFTIVPTPNVNLFLPRPSHCAAELGRRVRRAIADANAAFRRDAKRQLRTVIRSRWIAPPREGVWLLTGSSWAPTDLAKLQHRGAFAWTGGSNVADTAIYGLLPDGVASVEFTFRRFEPTGHWANHHPVTLRYGTPVNDNLVYFHVPLTLRDAWIARQVWHASDGRVIRVVPGA